MSAVCQLKMLCFPTVTVLKPNLKQVGFLKTYSTNLLPFHLVSTAKCLWTIGQLAASHADKARSSSVYPEGHHQSSTSVLVEQQMVVNYALEEEEEVLGDFAAWSFRNVTK